MSPIIYFPSFDVRSLYCRFICSEATEGELSRMAVEHLLGDSSLGHNKRRADMATIGLQILLQSRQWRDALKR